MDSIVSGKGAGNKKVGIQYVAIPGLKVRRVYWIHVMNQNLAKYGTIRTTKITTVIPDDDLIPNSFPLGGTIEPLVHPSLMAESLPANGTIQLKVLESFFIGGQSYEFRISKNWHDQPFAGVTPD